MKNKAHLQTINHFSLVVLDTALFKDSWEKAFGFKIPSMSGSGDSKQDKEAMLKLFKLLKHMPTYKGGPMPMGKSYKKDAPFVPPIYQPHNRMIEVKAAGSMPSATDTYDKFGNSIQYFGIVEGNNRDPFLNDLKENYGCEILEEMFYDPLPGDFCIVETEKQLGFNLCVKADGALNGAVNVIMQDTAECTIVTEDIEEAVETWTDIFEIKKPEIKRIKDEIIYQGNEVNAEYKVARIDEAPFTIYLAEDNNNGPFSAFSKKNKYGIQHVCFDMNDKCEEFKRHMKDVLDIDVLTEYDLEDKHYILFDSVDKMGACIGIRRNNA